MNTSNSLNKVFLGIIIVAVIPTLIILGIQNSNLKNKNSEAVIFGWGNNVNGQLGEPKALNFTKITQLANYKNDSILQIAWIIVGGIAGWIASMVMKTDRSMGLASNVLVGMVGSLVGGALVVLFNTGTLDLFNTAYNNLDFGSLIISTLGAIVLLAILKAVSARNTVA